MVTTDNINPKVFISHASEDKDRFVIEFASKLLNKGIDAWVDRWEMLPGDSIVDKIFEEGIKNAQAIIVVLSKYSVNKKWVREELNSAFVNKINKNSKLIPVIIDDCEVPEVLKSTVWERINDLKNYETEFNRIVMSIYGMYDKPPLGTVPKYTQIKTDTLPGLNEIDTHIFKVSCETAISQESPFIETDNLSEKITEYDISKELLSESLQILESRSYISAIKSASGEIPAFTLRWNRFDEYLRHHYPDYSILVDTVSFKVVNENKIFTKDIGDELNVSKAIINCIIAQFRNRGLVEIEESASGDYYITSITADFKRLMRAGGGGIGG